MDALNALGNGISPVNVSLEGYQLAYVRATAAWDTQSKCLPDHLVYLVESGKILLSHGDNQTQLSSGWAALIPPKTTFRASAASPEPRFWRLRITLPVPWPAVTVHAGVSDLEPVITRLVFEANQSPSPLRDAAIRGGLMVLLAGLQRNQPSATLPGLTPTQKMLLENYTDDNPEATPRDLMRVLDLTLDYGTRLFTRTFTRPPRQWLLERRMHRAATRVAESDEPIKLIANDLGYSDVRLFIRQFKTVLGQPPARFRAQVRNDHLHS